MFQEIFFTTIKEKVARIKFRENSKIKMFRKFNPIQDGPFWGRSWMGGRGAKRPRP